MVLCRGEVYRYRCWEVGWVRWSSSAWGFWGWEADRLVSRAVSAVSSPSALPRSWRGVVCMHGVGGSSSISLLSYFRIWHGMAAEIQSTVQTIQTIQTRRSTFGQTTQRVSGNKSLTASRQVPLALPSWQGAWPAAASGFKPPGGPAAGRTRRRVDWDSITSLPRKREGIGPPSRAQLSAMHLFPAANPASSACNPTRNAY